MTARRQYQTMDGDTLDWVCWRHYGRSEGTVEAVLADAENMRLADLGPVYDAGVLIALPEMPSAPVAETVRLWD